MERLIARATYVLWYLTMWYPSMLPYIIRHWWAEKCYSCQRPVAHYRMYGLCNECTRTLSREATEDERMGLPVEPLGRLELARKRAGPKVHVYET